MYLIAVFSVSMTVYFLSSLRNTPIDAVAAVNPNDIKTILTNGFSRFFIKGKLVFSNLSRNLPVNTNTCVLVKLNFRRPQSRKFFYGRFINAVHLVHAPIIAVQNDLQRALYPLSVLAGPRTDRLTFIM